VRTPKDLMMNHEIPFRSLPNNLRKTRVEKARWNQTGERRKGAKEREARGGTQYPGVGEEKRRERRERGRESTRNGARECVVREKPDTKMKGHGKERCQLFWQRGRDGTEVRSLTR
jgi:hypothetical protein